MSWLNPYTLSKQDAKEFWEYVESTDLVDWNSTTDRGEVTFTWETDPKCTFTISVSTQDWPGRFEPCIHFRAKKSHINTFNIAGENGEGNEESYGKISLRLICWIWDKIVEILQTEGFDGLWQFYHKGSIYGDRW